jgi:rhamnogalacturonan endolyase
VKAGIYRLTVYAEDVFGWFIQDNVTVQSTVSSPTEYHWREESAGTEVWRIGTPDKSAGEFKHGNKQLANKAHHPEEFRQYWATWDFPTDFPNGVDFKVGASNISEDFNYIHWSVFPNGGNWFRSEPYFENVNNWTIRFDLTHKQLSHKTNATLTVDLAGIKTGSNNDLYVNLPYTLNVNDKDVETWIIPWWTSTSCGVRSAVSCRQAGHKFSFPIDLLTQGENIMVLSLPFNATSIESANLPWTTYLQYDALRLELA